MDVCDEIMEDDAYYFDYFEDSKHDRYAMGNQWCVSWCPFCERQRYLVRIMYHNYWCDQCGCVIIKFVGGDINPRWHKHRRTNLNFCVACQREFKDYKEFAEHMNGKHLRPEKSLYMYE